VAVLWTDERRDWEGVLSQLKRERLRQWLNRDGGQLWCGCGSPAAHWPPVHRSPTDAWTCWALCKRSQSGG